MFHLLKTIRSKIRELESDIFSDIPLIGDVVDLRHEIEEAIEEHVYPIVTTALNLLDSSSPEVSLFRAFFPELKELYAGDHVYVQRPGFTHHGILTNDGTVIEYDESEVIEIPLSDFARNVQPRKRSGLDSPSEFSSDQIVDRAKSRLDECNYDALFNNCEHFARWCRCGE